MSIEEFKTKYILNDGQVLSFVCDFTAQQIQVRLNIRKQIRNKTDSCELNILFNGVIELDVLDNFDVSSYSDVVFVKMDTGNYYASFDPYDNSGAPSDNDNFVIKSREVIFFDGEERTQIT